MIKRRAGCASGSLPTILPDAAFYARSRSTGDRIGESRGGRPFLLSTAFIVALLDATLGGLLRKTRRMTIPQFLRQVVALLIYLIALLLVLSIGYNAQSELKGLLAGSGIAAIIIGFATQDLFGGIISGIALQISKPYKVGDWLHIQDRFAEVMEINWRSTRLRTNDGIYLDVPTTRSRAGTIINLHYPTQGTRSAPGGRRL